MRRLSSPCSAESRLAPDLHDDAPRALEDRLLVRELVHDRGPASAERKVRLLRARPRRTGTRRAPRMPSPVAADRACSSTAARGEELGRDTSPSWLAPSARSILLPTTTCGLLAERRVESPELEVDGVEVGERVAVGERGEIDQVDENRVRMRWRKKRCRVPRRGTPPESSPERRRRRTSGPRRNRRRRAAAPAS